MFSNLSIERYIVTDLSVSFDESFFSSEFSQDELNDALNDKAFDVDFNLKVNKNDENRYLASLRIEYGYKESYCPFKYKIHLLGFYRVDADTSEEERKKILPLNPIAILHGVARGLLGNIFSQGPVSGYVLPSFNFSELYKAKIAKANEERRSSKDLSISSKKPKRTVKKKKTATKKPPKA